MLKIKSFIALVIFLECQFNVIWKVESKNVETKPLILSEYIEKGRISEGRNAAIVPPLAGNVKSYAGYFTVDKRYDSNLYLWYFPSETNPKTAPVVVWLQGGPGGTSMYGIFKENGPYRLVDGGNSVRKRDIYWSRSMHIIYIDNPVGSGFSYTNSSDGYLKDQVSIGNSLHVALLQFFELFPELKKLDLYLSGESYAGKYVPALSRKIHFNNMKGKNRINLKGLAIASAFVDPLNQIDYGIYLYEIGLISENQKKVIDEGLYKVKENIKKKSWVQALEDFNKVIDSNGGKNSLFYKFSGFSDVSYYLDPGPYIMNDDLELYLNKNYVQRQIHAARKKFSGLSSKVSNSLVEDILQSTAPLLADLLNNYKVLMFNGQLDIICAYPLAWNYLKQLDWCGAEEFVSAERRKWNVDGKLAGYITTSAPTGCNGSLSLALVRDSGHAVPKDQPLWAYHLINDFVHSKNNL